MTSPQCVEAFSPAQPGEEQNLEGYGLQSGQYLHSWGGVVTLSLLPMISARRQFPLLPQLLLQKGLVVKVLRAEEGFDEPVI